MDDGVSATLFTAENQVNLFLSAAVLVSIVYIYIHTGYCGVLDR